MIRKIVLGFVLALICSTSFAQNNVKRDSTYKKMDYFHFEAAWLTWMNKPDSVKVKALSHAFSAYLSYPMQLGKSKLSFTPGIGIMVDNAYLNSQTKYADSARSTVALYPIKSGVSYKNNKQTFAYLTIPVSLNYNANGNSKSWKASLGLRFNYLINSHSKYKGNDPITGYSEKVKTFNIPYTNKYRMDAALTVGYDWVYIMATYGLTTYTASGKGPQYQPFTIGVGMVGF